MAESGENIEDNSNTVFETQEEQPIAGSDDNNQVIVASEAKGPDEAAIGGEEEIDAEDVQEEKPGGNADAVADNEKAEDEKQDSNSNDAKEEEDNDEDNDDEEDDDEDNVNVVIEDFNFRAAQKQQPQSQQPKQPTIDFEASQTALDVDISTLEDKPWRKPGADLNDYFNYGFDESTWRMYCDRQKKMKVAANEMVLTQEAHRIPVISDFNKQPHQHSYQIPVVQPMIVPQSMVVPPPQHMQRGDLRGDPGPDLRSMSNSSRIPREHSSHRRSRSPPHSKSSSRMESSRHHSRSKDTKESRKRSRSRESGHRKSSNKESRKRRSRSREDDRHKSSSKRHKSSRRA